MQNRKMVKHKLYLKEAIEHADHVALGYPRNTDCNRCYEEVEQERKFLIELGVSVYYQGTSMIVKAKDLYDILSNGKKLNNLVSKLKMKAFW
jgi:hypothetical protein